MKVVAFKEEAAEEWDSFVPRTAQGVFLHTRRFLSYHNDRFKDRSLLLFDEKNRLRALFPAALSPADANHVVSHPGLTFGGLLHLPDCRADEVQAQIRSIREHFRAHDLRQLTYRSIPAHIQNTQVALDHYALWHAGAQIIRRDLWNVVDLKSPRRLSKGHKWSLNKARKNEVRAFPAPREFYQPFHENLTENLSDRHDTSPVHNLPELLQLQDLFPDNITLWVATSGSGELIAGVWLFQLHEYCWHTQYITSNSVGRDLFAVNLLLEHLVSEAQKAGVQTFSFGASTEDSGKYLNAGLYSFKASFGAGSAIHDHFGLEL